MPPLPPGRIAPRLLLVVPLVAISLAFADASTSQSGAGDPLPPRYEFYLDPFVGEESGARNVAAAVTLVGAGEERLDRSAVGRGAAGIVLRPMRTVAWDLPVAWWFGVALHEAFGHGGRAREFNASPGVHLGTPWQGRVSYATFDAEGQSTESLLYIYIGGTEGNGLAATLLERRVVEGVRLRPLDLFFLASNRLVATRYVLGTTPDPRRSPDRFFAEYSGGGDVANYLGLLHELHGGGSGITAGGVDDQVARQYRRLRRQAFWNGLDPGLWWALASAFRMEARGDDSAALPLPRAGGLRCMPVFSSEWTPSGGQTSLEWIAARAERPASWFSLVARRGRGPSGSFGALGAAADDLLRSARLGFGGAAEVWIDPRNGLGGGVRLRLRLLRGYFRGLLVDVGVKSQGYWVGQPESPGPYGAIGLRYEP